MCCVHHAQQRRACAEHSRTAVPTVASHTGACPHSQDPPVPPPADRQGEPQGITRVFLPEAH
eukprot:360543-Chlamydomonas_euryale.AAC.4